MATPNPITLTVDRRIFEHSDAVHLRRMRGAIYVYLALLARIPNGHGTVEVDPEGLAKAMGLPQGTVRSWLGHLRKAGYIALDRLNGSTRVTIGHEETPAPTVESTPKPTRFFTPAKVMRALGERPDPGAIEDAVGQYTDPVIRRALAGTLATPADQIRRSRTALFLYLTKRYAQEP
jgi:hypothetical protein